MLFFFLLSFAFLFYRTMCLIGGAHSLTPLAFTAQCTNPVEEREFSNKNASFRVDEKRSLLYQPS